MKLVHFFHIYADGDWEQPITEHFDALAETTLPEYLKIMCIGMVGTPENRSLVRQWLFERAKGDLPMPELWLLYKACADEGWEQTTLAPLQDFARGFIYPDDEAYYLYAHTKGAWVRGEDDINVWWRRSMTWDMVTRWEECVRLLEEGNDAVGSHRIHEPHGNGYFGGNFWWAKGSYLATLPDLSYNNRYEAESWIADGGGKLHDLRPGWPGFGVFAPEIMALRKEQ